MAPELWLPLYNIMTIF